MLGEAPTVSVDCGERQRLNSHFVNTAADVTKPRLVEGVDILKLAIGPEEAFVLSRVDGQSSLQDIVYATGLAPDRVERALARLVELGAVRWVVSVMPASAQVTRAAAQLHDVQVNSASSAQAASGVRAMAPGATALPYDPAELEGTFDLDLQKRQMILERYYLADTSNHYEVLGVLPGAERKAIKSAYFELVAVLHPDKYFGKNVGHFRQKMERCFERLTEAYEVLSRAESRDMYDAYLKSQQQVADLQRALDMRVTPDELDRIEAELIRLAETGFGSGAPSPLGVQTPPPSTSASMQFRVLSEQERRQALASALRRSTPGIRFGQNSGNGRSSSPELTPNTDGLRHHYESRLRRAREVKLKLQLQLAEESLAKNDPVAACDALRVAQKLAPNDASIAAHLRQVQAQASSVLAARYLEQARYEEEHGRMDIASRNYAHAAQVNPSAELWEKAARCGHTAKLDMRAAAEMAKKAIDLAPERAALHILLAEIYLDAQLSASAAAQLERAARLSPNDDSIRALRRRLERNGT